MAIYFVRHGETRCNVKGVYYGSLNVPITEKGQKQAEAVGEMLKDVVFDRVIISGLQRTKQTAQAVLSRQNPANGVPKDFQSLPSLNEMDFGAWEGLHYTEVKAKYPEDYHGMMTDWVHCPPTDGEIFLQFRERILKCWKELKIDPKENVLFVGHGGPIQVILSDMLGMDPSGIWHLAIKQGAYTKIELQGDFPILKGMNLERSDTFE